MGIIPYSRRYEIILNHFSKNFNGKWCLIYRAFLTVIESNQFSVNLFLTLTFSSSYMCLEDEPTVFKNQDYQLDFLHNFLQSENHWDLCSGNTNKNRTPKCVRFLFLLISAAWRIRTTENALFSEFHNECKQHEGLEPSTMFGPLSFFCVSHKMFTNSILQNKSISSPRGFEPAKSRNKYFSKSIHLTHQRIRTGESQKLTCWSQRKKPRQNWAVVLAFYIISSTNPNLLIRTNSLFFKNKRIPFGGI